MRIVPLIHGPDGAKLSKRHGALAVEAYRDMGYLPEAMRNYLLRLGWSHGDEEIIPTAQAIEWFDLDGIGRSPARFDMKKLDSLNGHYIREMDDAALAAEAARLCRAARRPGALSPPARARLKTAMAGLKARAKTLIELVDKARVPFRRRRARARSAPRPKCSRRKRAHRLAGSAAVLDRRLGHAQLEERVRAFAEKEGVKLGDVAQPLRAALTGRTTSPPVFDVLSVLGRDESLSRIRPHTD